MSGAHKRVSGLQFRFLQKGCPSISPLCHISRFVNRNIDIILLGNIQIKVPVCRMNYCRIRQLFARLYGLENETGLGVLPPPPFPLPLPGPSGCSSEPPEHAMIHNAVAIKKDNFFIYTLLVKTKINLSNLHSVPNSSSFPFL